MTKPRVELRIGTLVVEGTADAAALKRAVERALAVELGRGEPPRPARMAVVDGGTLPASPAEPGFAVSLAATLARRIAR